MSITVKRGEPVRVSTPDSKEKGSFLLSNLDHDLYWVRTVYGFESGDRGNGDAGEVIRTSLRELLVHYYPLAGRLTDVSPGKLVVDRFEEGVVFVEAEAAGCSIQDVEDVAKIDPTRLCDFVYDDGIHGSDPERALSECPLMVVQVTKLKCGGFIFGLCLSHCLVDGLAVMELVNSWAEIARGVPISVHPSFDKTVFQPRNPPKVEFDHLEFAEMEDRSSLRDSIKEKTVYKVINFDLETLKKLKASVSKDGLFCTTFECLTGHVWRAWSKALNMAPDQETKLLVAVNVRNKMDPPPPKGYFGNCIVPACTTSKAGDLDSGELSRVVASVGKSTRMVTEARVRSGIDLCELERKKYPLAYTMMPTTWSRIPFRATDFGWGDAILMLPVALPFDGMVIFLSDHYKEKNGDMGIFIGLPQTAMETFEKELMLV